MPQTASLHAKFGSLAKTILTRIVLALLLIPLGVSGSDPNLAWLNYFDQAQAQSSSQYTVELKNSVTKKGVPTGTAVRRILGSSKFSGLKNTGRISLKTDTDGIKKLAKAGVLSAIRLSPSKPVKGRNRPANFVAWKFQLFAVMKKSASVNLLSKKQIKNAIWRTSVLSKDKLRLRRPVTGEIGRAHI